MVRRERNMKRRAWRHLPASEVLSERPKTVLGEKIFGNLFAPVVILLLAMCSSPFRRLTTLILATSSIPSATAFSTVSISIRGAAQAQGCCSFLRNSRHHPYTNSVLGAYKPVVVVGKIIIDEYGDPYPDSSDEAQKKNHDSRGGEPALPKTVSIGGGGPQAAFGAAAALAVWETFFRSDWNNWGESLPPPSPVVFVAPVGKDWTHSETVALESSLGALASVVVHNNTVETETFGNASPSNDSNRPVIEAHLVRSSRKAFFTPRIRLWHDQDQIVHWYDLNDSFGPMGADGLWRNNPSAKDLTSILDQNDGYNPNNSNEDSKVVLHAIAETWTGAAGGKLDFLPLVQDEALCKRLFYVGVEPVASGETVSKEDASEAAFVLRACSESIAAERDYSWRKNSLFWCPDRDLDEAMLKHDLYNEIHTGIRMGNPWLELAIRDGPRGSRIRYLNNLPFPNASEDCIVPAANLTTPDGAPLDPTGAGNAYSGAMTALLGNDVPWMTAACIASGVGAVVCEYEGLPSPSHWQTTLDRIASAAREVESELSVRYPLD